MNCVSFDEKVTSGVYLSKDQNSIESCKNTIVF